MLIIQIFNITKKSVVIFGSCKIWVLSIFGENKMVFIKLRIVFDYKQLINPIFLKCTPICLELPFKFLQTGAY